MMPGALLLFAEDRKRMNKMELMSMEMLKSGLISGAVVAAVSAAAVMSIGALVQENGTAGAAGQWAAVSVVFGIVAAFAYVVLSGTFGLGWTGYLGLALGMAAVLTAMELLPMYGGSAFAPHWQTYAALNFIYALGFGLMVPWLMG